MPKRSNGEWRGAQVKAKVIAAAKQGVDLTMIEAARHAKFNHAGWQNRTGIAEGSIRVQQFAANQGMHVRGSWGSVGVAYMGVLEYLHGAALRSAADAAYPNLPANIRRSMR